MLLLKFCESLFKEQRLFNQIKVYIFAENCRYKLLDRSVSDWNHLIVDIFGPHCHILYNFINIRIHIYLLLHMTTIIMHAQERVPSNYNNKHLKLVMSNCFNCLTGMWQFVLDHILWRWKHSDGEKRNQFSSNRSYNLETNYTHLSTQYQQVFVIHYLTF